MPQEDYSVDCRECSHFDDSKMREIAGCLGQCLATGRGILDSTKQECCLDFSGEETWKLNFILW